MANKNVNECILGARQAFKNLGDKDVQALVDLVQQAKKDSELKNKDVAEVVQDYHSLYVREIQMSKKQRLLSLQKYEEQAAFIKQFGDDPKRGIEALIQFDHKSKYKGSGTIERRKAQLENDAHAMIGLVLNKHKGLKEKFVKGEIELDLYKVLMGEDVKGIGKDVLELGTAIKKVNNMLFERKRQVGFNTGYLEKYVAPQRWIFRDMEKFGEMEWKQLFRDSMDWDGMGFKVDIDIDDYIDRFWENRKSRKPHFSLDDEMEHIVLNRVSEKMGKHRRLHFKDATAMYNYHTQVSGQGVFERIMGGIHRDSGHIAAADMFGPNYRATLKQLINDHTDKLDYRAADNLKKLLEYSIEGDRQPEMNIAARFVDKLKKITDMSKLGMALPTTMTDFAFSAGILSGNTGKNFLQAQYDVVNEFMKTLNPKVRREVSAKLHVFSTDINSLTMTHRFGDNITTTSFFDKTHAWFMQATGLPLQSSTMRLATAKLFSTELASQAGKGFDQLHIGLRQGFEKFGIGAEQWDILKHAIDDFGDGTKGVTIEAINSLDDSLFKGMKKDQIAKTKADLSNAVGGYLSEMAEVGSPTPGTKQKFFKQGLDRNSATGMAVNLMLQYKSFALAQFDTMRNVAYSGVGDGINAKNLAATIAAASGWGYLALITKDVMKGRDPMAEHNPLDAKTWMDAFVQSGAGLIYTDFLTAEYNKSYRSISADIAGPVLGGVVNDVGTLFAKGVRGDVKSGEILDKLERNTPSLFMTKAVINRNIYESIYRAMNNKPSRKSRKYHNNFNLLD